MSGSLWKTSLTCHLIPSKLYSIGVLARMIKVSVRKNREPGEILTSVIKRAKRLLLSLICVETVSAIDSAVQLINDDPQAPVTGLVF